MAQRQGRFDAASKLRYAVIPELESQLPKDQDSESSSHDDVLSPHGGLPFLHERVTSSDIARVVARATGIPVQSLLKGEREKLTHVCNDACLVLSPLRVLTHAVVNARWETRSVNEL